MKKSIIFFVFSFLLAFSTSSCNRGSGCPAETAQVKTDKHGNYKVGKSKSHLFPKKSKKKKKKKN